MLEAEARAFRPQPVGTISTLGERLASPHEPVRVGAHYALGLLQAHDVRDRIASLLNDPQPMVRQEAAAMLEALALGQPT